MSDAVVAEPRLVDADKQPLPSLKAPARNPLLDHPILPTILRLAWPNVIALTAGAVVVIFETTYVGRLGTEALAAMALVFPFVMLTMTMSGGAMGGGVSSAIARALGAGDRARADTLAGHALLIAICFGLTFTVGMLTFGSMLLQLLGGRGNVLSQAQGYITVFFAGGVIPWLLNTFAAILRGTGNMKMPSAMQMAGAALQVVLGGVLGLGFGPIPQFGMPGVAAGTLTAFTIGTGVMGWYVFSGRARVRPRLKGFRIQRGMFFDILKVGAIACFNPLQGVLTLLIFTHMLAQYGTAVLAGYGIGARLEFMLSTLAFAVGIASVPIVGMAIGAGRIARARRVTWTGSVIAFGVVGLLGTLIAIFPDAWVNLFTNDAGVRAASRTYLATCAPMYAFLGLSTVAYFASQGAAKVLGPVLAQTARLVFVSVGGWYLLSIDASATSFFWLAAASMVLLGVLSALSVLLTSWGPKAGPVPEIRPELV
ncbi:MATE family efflux transporter [Tardiphaga sp. 768_D3_N2_1]|uniref:MATE family efflux transporter n=1 Tax=Tardiphaga sp. 768_D3_N2_1 TaxID=3240783 RepID=UPI003F8AB5C6